MECIECGTTTEYRTIVRDVRVGGILVKAAVPADVCPSCGHHNMTAAELMHIDLKAAIVAFRDAPERIDGSALKFARKSMGLMQKQLAELLGRGAENVCRYERTGRSVPRATALAVATFLDKVARYGEASLVPGWVAPDDGDMNFKIAV